MGFLMFFVFSALYLFKVYAEDKTEKHVKSIAAFGVTIVVGIIFAFTGVFSY